MGDPGPCSSAYYVRDRLLEDKDGVFYSMCEKTGDLPRLVALARESAAGAAAQQSVGNGSGAVNGH